MWEKRTANIKGKRLLHTRTQTLKICIRWFKFRKAFAQFYSAYEACLQFLNHGLNGDMGHALSSCNAETNAATQWTKVGSGWREGESISVLIINQNVKNWNWQSQFSPIYSASMRIEIQVHAAQQCSVSAFDKLSRKTNHFCFSLESRTKYLAQSPVVPIPCHFPTTWGLFKYIMNFSSLWGHKEFNLRIKSLSKDMTGIFFPHSH